MAICDRSKQVVHWADSAAASKKMGIFLDGKVADKKETPRKDVSVICSVKDPSLAQDDRVCSG